jgi:hypothetical protein
MSKELKTKREIIEKDLREYALYKEHIYYCESKSFLNEEGKAMFDKFKKIDLFIDLELKNGSVIGRKKLHYIENYDLSKNGKVYLNAIEYCEEQGYTDRTLFNITKAIIDDLYTMIYEL